MKITMRKRNRPVNTAEIADRISAKIVAIPAANNIAFERYAANAKAVNPEAWADKPSPEKPAQLTDNQMSVASALNNLVSGTDEALCDYYNDEVECGFADWRYQSDASIRSRRAELVRLGVVRDTGRKFRTDSGRRAIIWEVNPTREIQTKPKRAAYA